MAVAVHKCITVTTAGIVTRRSENGGAVDNSVGTREAECVRNDDEDIGDNRRDSGDSLSTRLSAR